MDASTAGEGVDKAAARSIHLIRIMMIVLVATLVVGMIAVAAALVTTVARQKPSADYAGTVTLAPGEEIAHIALGGDRLVLHVKGSAGEQIRIFDAGGAVPLGAIDVERAE